MVPLTSHKIADFSGFKLHKNLLFCGPHRHPLTRFHAQMVPTLISPLWQPSARLRNSVRIGINGHVGGAVKNSPVDETFDHGSNPCPNFKDAERVRPCNTQQGLEGLEHSAVECSVVHTLFCRQIPDI